jgi:WD40 repeat protein
VELAYRRRSQETLSGEEYRQRFPGQTEVIDALFAPTEDRDAKDHSAVQGTSRCASVADTGIHFQPTDPGRPREGSTEDAPPASNVIDLPSIPGYEILGELGRGGMGIVYKARQISLNRTVALKMVLAGQFASAVDVQRFRTEAEAAAHLDHPHIVPIYEVGQHEGHHYFSMKPFEGGSLADHLQRFLRDPRAAAQLLVRVARAVHYAHQRGVLHRDLKPGNILLDSHGQPHVTDFGLAKRVEGDKRLTQTGAIVGTPGYMAPEQARSEKVLTTAVDVYSLGAILYVLLTGRPPFQAGTPLDTVLQVLENEPLRPRKLNPRADRDLETICLKCLEKDPQRRYGSAEALADDAERWTVGEPILARPSSVLEQTIKWAKRRPAIAALVGALMVVALIGFVLVTWKWNEATVERDRAQQAERDAAERAAEEALAKQKAFDALQLVEREKQETQKQLHRADMALYVNRITLAQRLLADLDVGKAERVLDTCQENLRHWEYRYLYRLCRNRMRTFRVPKGGAHHVIFSPDGQHLAFRTDDGAVKVWDARTGQEKLSLKIRPSKTTRLMYQPNLAYSPDGQRIASIAEDKVVKVWDALTGEEKLTLRHEDEVNSVAFSPDGRNLATALTSTVILWDAKTGQEAHPLFFIPGATDIAFAAGGRYLAAARIPLTWIRVWDVQEDKSKVTIRATDDWLVSMAISPDGKRVATGSAHLLRRDAMAAVGGDQPAFDPFRPGRVIVWDVDTGRELLNFEAHPMPAMDLAFSPDGSRLATAGFDSAVKLWDVQTGHATLTLKGHGAPVHRITFRSDGKRLASVSQDQTLRVWEVTPSLESLSLQGHSAAVIGVAINPERTRVAAACFDGMVNLWDVPSGRHSRVLKKHKNPVFCVAFSPDGSYLASGGGPNNGKGPWEVTIWETKTAQVKHYFRGHAGVVRGLAFSPDSQWLTGACIDGTVKLWDVSNGQERRSIQAHRAPVMDVAFSPSGQLLASASADGTVRCWNVQTAQETCVLKGHSDAVNSVSFSPDGKSLASGSRDGTVKLWNITTAQEQLTLTNTTGIWSTTFSPDGRRLVAALDAPYGRGGEVRMWDRETGQEVLSLQGHRSAVYSVKFSPDGQFLVSAGGGGFGGEVHVWSACVPDQ